MVTSFSLAQSKTGYEICLALQENNFSSNIDAEDALDKIMYAAGLSKNFALIPCDNINNAAALSFKGVRYIFYNKEFMSLITSNANNWSNITILAHEVGHHLNGHSLDISMAKIIEPKSLLIKRKQELEADEFAGFIMSKLGAPINEIQDAISVISSDKDDTYSTHPSKFKRLNAIKKGFDKAGNKVATNYVSNDYQVIETYSENIPATSKIVDKAVKENENGNFDKAGDLLISAYQLSAGKDKVYLYYAASSYVNGNHYEKALNAYKNLVAINYGSENTYEYYLTDIKTDARELIEEDQIESAMSSGDYYNLEKIKKESKLSEVLKNIALIHTQLGQDDKALDAYRIAREKNPNDVSLILNQANLYFKQGDKDTFKSLMNEAAEIDPTNPDLFYNIGVINMEQGNSEEARAAYSKAVELSPTYINAYLNLSTSFVNEGNNLINEMNNLGNSKKDIYRYDVLKAQKQVLFKKAAQVLEAGLAANENDLDLLGQLKNIYGATGDNRNVKRVERLLNKYY